MSTLKSDVEAATLAPRELIHVRWGAILAGLLVSILCAGLLNLLGIGLGLTTFHLDQQHFSTLKTVGMLWYICVGVISLYAGGWASGFFSHTTHKIEGLLYGALTWSLFILLSLILSVSGASMFVGGVFNTLTRSSENLTKQTINMVMLPVSDQLLTEGSEMLSNLKEQVAILIDEVGKRSAHGGLGEASSETEKALSKLASQNKRFELIQNITFWLKADSEKASQKAKESIIDLLQKNTQLRKEEIESVLKDWQEYYASMKQSMDKKFQAATAQATHLVEMSTRAVGRASLYIFFIMTITGMAASFGSLKGAKASILDSKI